MTASKTVAGCAPTHILAGRLCSTFGLEPVDHERIREATREEIFLSADALQPTVNETATKIHPRGIGSFGNSAHGATQFCSQKVTQARHLTSKLAMPIATRTAKASTASKTAPPAPASSPPKPASPVAL